MPLRHITNMSETRPYLTGKVIVGIIVGIICFSYLEAKSPSDDRKKELLILLGSTLVGIGMDSIVVLLEKYHYVCLDE